jgi:hypothetical protein
VTRKEELRLPIRKSWYQPTPDANQHRNDRGKYQLVPPTAR